MFREQFWPRNRPFWMAAGKRIESSKILKSIHMSNSEFKGFQIGAESWEVRKKSGESDLIIQWFKDLMIQIISRHRSKWPISRTMSPGTTTAITVLECVTGGSWSLATKSSVLCSPGNSYWAKWAQNRHWFMFFSIFWQIRLRIELYQHLETHHWFCGSRKN